MTEKLWSCLRFFTSLKQLSIADSSLSFPPSPPELPSVTKLSAERVTPQSYEAVLSSVPGVREIEISIDNAETNNSFQITTASRPNGQSGLRDKQIFVHIKLHAWQGLTTDRKIDSGESIGGLSLLFEDQTKKQQRLHVSGVKGRDEEALVDMFVKTKQLTYLNSESGGGSLNKNYSIQILHVTKTAEHRRLLYQFPSISSRASIRQEAISRESNAAKLRSSALIGTRCERDRNLYR
ncbi:uncharacterized protein LOC105438533 [Strongylocentrotus purpuratus]|uniref:Uncharacterized protein n=1 Tax=Strongylocentrotus purpuratus TaxID=7668 RepID=A0A7M7LVQ7_STRPU|nr:uncharacterized protein LOC105438533 [Strongylocentrotus purpuratus]|eukprot:XP_011664765.1 PREDICTED: uncharacterized protein LOC105438533 [Strongylocentrotus purpuratus]